MRISVTVITVLRDSYHPDFPFVSRPVVSQFRVTQITARSSKAPYTDMERTQSAHFIVEIDSSWPM